MLADIVLCAREPEDVSIVLEAVISTIKQGKKLNYIPIVRFALELEYVLLAMERGEYNANIFTL